MFNLKDNRVINIISSPEKFAYLRRHVASVRESLQPQTRIEFMDVGCSAGLTSLLAYEAGYDKVVSLDHDKEYIAMLSDVLTLEKNSVVEPHEFSFGEPFAQKVDVMFVGALIHWVFTCTAAFGRFDKIMAYLMTGVSKVLIIEWVDPQDRAIQSFHHIEGCGSQSVAEESYSVANFERSLQQIGTISEKWHPEMSITRTIYTVIIA